jgi:hypothetical protein
MIHITVQWTKTKHIEVEQQKQSNDLPLSKPNLIQTKKYVDITDIKFSPWFVTDVDIVRCFVWQQTLFLMFLRDLLPSVSTVIVSRKEKIFVCRSAGALKTWEMEG